jgi:hypothetical protein
MALAILVLQLGAAFTALLAAWYWFCSARAKAPPMTWEGVGTLQGWLDEAAGHNRRAAAFAGASAFLTAISTALGVFS